MSAQFATIKCEVMSCWFSIQFPHLWTEVSGQFTCFVSATCQIANRFFWKNEQRKQEVIRKGCCWALYVSGLFKRGDHLEHVLHRDYDCCLGFKWIASLYGLCQLWVTCSWFALTTLPHALCRRTTHIQEVSHLQDSQSKCRINVWETNSSWFLFCRILWWWSQKYIYVLYVQLDIPGYTKACLLDWHVYIIALLHKLQVTAKALQGCMMALFVFIALLWSWYFSVLPTLPRIHITTDKENYTNLLF